MDKTFDKFKEEILAEVKKLIGGGTPPPEQKPPADPPVDLTLEENDKLSELAESRAKEMIRVARRKDHVVEFAATLTGGTKERPFGLPVRASEVTKLLLELPEAQAAKVERMLTLALDAAVDFAEHGIGGEGFLQRPKLPDYLRPAMVEWVAAGRTVKDFFKEVATELKMEDFNVAEFEKEKE